MQFIEQIFEIEVPKGVDSTQVVQVTGFEGAGTGLGCYLARKYDHTEILDASAHTL